MKTHLTVQEIAMYLGCKVYDSYNDRIGILQDVQMPDEVGVKHKAIYMLNVNEIKLILRKLESMTEEESKEHRKLMFRGTDGVHTVVIYQNTPESFAYLLSKGFDLFGYIPAGLAIDKETLSK